MTAKVAQRVMAPPPVGHVHIYTDGAFCHKTDAGGWSALMYYTNPSSETFFKILSGRKKGRCSSELEAFAILRALKALKRRCIVSVFTDHQSHSNGNIRSLAEKNWVNSRGVDAKNMKILKEVYSLMQYHDVRIQWIKGHSHIYQNHLADSIAKKHMERMKYKISKKKREENNGSI